MFEFCVVAAVLVAVGTAVLFHYHNSLYKKASNLPPGSLGWPVIGETLAYLRDPDKFVLEHTQKYGPVFKSHVFLRPMVFVGGQSVADVIAQERFNTTSSLPDTFSQLHTPFGALNQAGAQHDATRVAYSHVFGPASMASLCRDVVARGIRQLDTRMRRDMTTQLADGTRCHDFSLWQVVQPFALLCASQLVYGEQLPARSSDDLVTYAAGLMAVLPVKLPFTTFGRGIGARDRLIADGLAVVKRRRQDKKPCMITTLFEVKDEHQQLWSDERIATVAMLFVWAALDETAAVACAALVALDKNPKHREALRRSLQLSRDPLRLGQDCPLLRAIIKESLRTEPPTGGGMRLTSKALTIGGFTVPKDWVLSADSRICALNEQMFVRPKEFLPQRWIEATESSTACHQQLSGLPVIGQAPVPPRAFAPTGIGRHACPGFRYAEIVISGIVAHWTMSFHWETRGPVAPYWNKIPIAKLDPAVKVRVSTAV